MRKRLQAVGPAWRLSRPVRERGRFTACETVRRRGVRAYRLPGLDAVALLRHDMGDGYVLAESLGPEYEAPEPVDRLLAAAAPPRVLDLGANVGFFGLRVLARHPRASIVAFEPDPANAAILRRCIELNGRDATWSVVEACAATTDGRLGFTGGSGAMSRLSGPGEPATLEVAARDVFPHMEGADLVKIDIEGGEWALLADERFAAASPPALFLEFHERLCPHESPRRAAAERLESLGYAVRHDRPAWAPAGEPFEAYGYLWGWRDR
jgi:FkbM family methyltransferase